MSISSCCLTGSEWEGVPSGVEEELAGLKTYRSGESSDTAILIIHDLFGWKFPNGRLLADHYAKQLNATAYFPDFFGGDELDWEVILKGDFAKLDLPTFMGKNNRHAREPEIFKFAQTLRSQYKKVCAVGFCYGGWAALRLGSKTHQTPLVDCITIGHPSLATEKDFDEVAVPIQILAPERDHQYTEELKVHSFQALRKSGVPFDYQHYPGLEHGCFIRGDGRIPGEQEAMLAGRQATVMWLSRFT